MNFLKKYFLKECFLFFLLNISIISNNAWGDHLIPLLATINYENQNTLKDIENRMDIDGCHITDFLIEKTNKETDNSFEEEDNEIFLSKAKNSESSFGSSLLSKKSFNEERKEKFPNIEKDPGNSFQEMIEYYDIASYEHKDEFITYFGLGDLESLHLTSQDLSQKTPKIVLQTYNINGENILNVLILDPILSNTNFKNHVEFYKKLKEETRIPSSHDNLQNSFLDVFYHGFNNKEKKDHFIGKFNKNLYDVLNNRSFYNPKELLKTLVKIVRGKTFLATKLPFVELISGFALHKFKERLNTHHGRIIFSGSGFSGAIAQEMAYQFLKKNSNRKNEVKVLTAQAMRYLSEHYVNDYLNVVGEDNIFSLRTNYSSIKNLKSPAQFGITFSTIYPHIVHLKPIENPRKPYILKNAEMGTVLKNFMDNIFNKYSTDDLIINGIFFKEQLKFMGYEDTRRDDREKIRKNDTEQEIKEKIKLIFSADFIDLDKIESQKEEQNFKIFSMNIMKDFDKKKKNEFVRYMLSIPKIKTDSAKAIATLSMNKLFIKLSKGTTENENLEMLRENLNIENNPTKINVGKIKNNKKELDVFFNIPASFVGRDNKNNDYTSTIAYSGGNYSALFFMQHSLENNLQNHELENTAYLCGAAVAKMHNTIEGRHGDIHAQNIRFSTRGNNIQNATEIHIIDVESASEKKGSDHLFEDILMFIAKSVAHKFKSKSYGINNSNDASRIFTMATLEGYISNLNESNFNKFIKEIKMIKDKDGKHLLKEDVDIKKIDINELLRTKFAAIFNLFNEKSIKQSIDFKKLKEIFQKVKNKFLIKKPEPLFLDRKSKKIYESA